MTAKIAGRVITGLAITLVVLAVALAVLPNPEAAYNEAEVLVQVDCGTPIRGSKYSSDDFCEDSLLRRAELSVLLLLPALLLAPIGLVLLHRDKRPRGEFVEPKRPW